MRWKGKWKIDHRVFKCREMTHLETEDKRGVMASKEEIIGIDSTYSEWDQLDTFLHEVLHAILEVRSLKKESYQEEEVVGMLSSGLTSFIKSNPGFVDKLKEMKR